MNFDAMGKLLGWLPGAGLGGLVGSMLAAFWWYPNHLTQCPGGTFNGPFGPVQTHLSCLETSVGTFYSELSFAPVGGLLGAVVGIIGTALYTHLNAPP